VLIGIVLPMSEWRWMTKELFLYSRSCLGLLIKKRLLHNCWGVRGRRLQPEKLLLRIWEYQKSPSLSSAEVKEWVELFLHSTNTPSWHGQLYLYLTGSRSLYVPSFIVISQEKEELTIPRIPYTYMTRHPIPGHSIFLLEPIIPTWRRCEFLM
jgi:hypothetical protein